MTIVLTDQSSDATFLELLRKRMQISTDVHLSPRKAPGAAANAAEGETGWCSYMRVRQTDCFDRGRKGRGEMSYARTVCYDKESRFVLLRDPNKDGRLFLAQTGPLEQCCQSECGFVL